MAEDDSHSSEADDPRLSEAFVRRVPGETAGDVVLVGVVHDHPASEHRVRSVVRSEAPDVLAVELAPLALPLFEQYAAHGPPAAPGSEAASGPGAETATGADAETASGDESETPTARGGEMSAAIAAAETDRVVAIDGPSAGFLRRLVGTLARERPALSTVRELGARFASVTAHVVRCRLAAAVGRVRARPPDVHDATEHDVSWADAAAEQAEDERRQVRRAASVLSALSSPTHATFRQELREAHMADRLAGLREDGDVVAVVGYGHLDAVAEQLASA